MQKEKSINTSSDDNSKPDKNDYCKIAKEIYSFATFKSDFYAAKKLSNSFKKTNAPKIQSFYYEELINHLENNIVYYEVEAGFPNPERITKAIAEYESKTNIRFAERTDQNNYVTIVTEGLEAGGYGGTYYEEQGKKFISLGDKSLDGTLIHEIGHLLGLEHEFDRKDRDLYLNFNVKNMKPEEREGYENTPTYSEAELLEFGKKYGEFDIESVMMYPSFWPQELVIDPCVPIITKKDGSIYEWKSVLSAGDIDFINKYYPKIE